MWIGKELYATWLEEDGIAAGIFDRDGMGYVVIWVR